MLSILILSQRGEGYGLATRFAQEGHVVKFWVEGPHDFVPTFSHERCKQVNRYAEHIESADLIIPCGRGFDSLGAGLRAQGKVVYGGGVSDFLEQEFIQVLGEDYTPNHKGETTLFVGFWAEGWKLAAQGRHLRRMLDGDRGPLVRGLGYMLQAANRCSSLETIPLKGLGYLGWVTLETADDKVVDFRLGIDPTVLGTLGELVGSNLGEVTYKLCVGEEVAPLTGYAGSLGLIDLVGLPPLELSEGAKKHFWNEPKGTFRGSITSRGQSVREVRRRLNRTIDSLDVSDYIYRNDI